MQLESVRWMLTRHVAADITKIGANSGRLGSLGIGSAGLQEICTLFDPFVALRCAEQRRRRYGQLPADGH